MEDEIVVQAPTYHAIQQEDGPGQRTAQGQGGEQHNNPDHVPQQDSEHALDQPSEQQTEHQHLPTPGPSEQESISYGQPHEIQSPDQEVEDNTLPLPRLLPVQYDTPPAPGAARGNRAPRGNLISTELSQENVVQDQQHQEGPRRSTRRQAYATLLTETQEGANASFHHAFTASLSLSKPETKEKPRTHRNQLPPEPKSFKQMLKHPKAPGFIQALKFEVRSLVGYKTWKLVKRHAATQANKRVIPLTWVFKYKFDTEGYLVKHKARLYVRGDLQVTEQDTYAATLAARTFRSLTAIMAAFDLESRQLDAVNAFVNSPIDEETYYELPEGMYLLEEYQGLELGLILQLLRALYGLKQSPALWSNHLSATLQELRLSQVPGVNCLFTNDFMIIFFYVDNIAVIYAKQNKHKVDNFQRRIQDTYQLRILRELKWFLAIRIVRDRP